MNASLRSAIVVLTALWAFAPSRAHAETSSIPTCRLAFELRCAFRMGPNELAVLGVDAATHTAIASLAHAYCEENRALVAPLIESLQDSKRELYAAFEGSLDLSEAEQALVDAVKALNECCGTIRDAMASELTDSQEAAHGNLLGNALIDPTLASLELTEQQKLDIVELVHDRETITCNPRQRKNHLLVSQAYAAFDTGVESILTLGQDQAFSQAQSNFLQGIQNCEEIEAALCEHLGGQGPLAVAGKKNRGINESSERTSDAWAMVITVVTHALFSR